MKDNNNLTVNQKDTEAAKVAGSTKASTLISYYQNKIIYVYIDTYFSAI